MIDQSHPANTPKTIPKQVFHIPTAAATPDKSLEPASADEALKKLDMAGLTATSTPTQLNAVVTTIMHAIGMHDPRLLP